MIDLTDSGSEPDSPSADKEVCWKKPAVEEFCDPDFPASHASIGFLRRQSEELCLCQAQCAVKTVIREGPNHGRRFLACAKKTCKYFRFLSLDEVSFDSAGVAWRRFRRSEGWRMRLSRGFNSADIQQGKLGNCWFLSALSVIAGREDLIEHIVMTSDLPDSGMVSFQLFLDGDWRVVTVDNSLPCSDGPQPSLLFAKASSSQLWVPLLEKAYAKAHGSYAAISGGEIAEAFLDLSGAPCEAVDFNHRQFSSELLWLQLVQWTSRGFPVGCATAESGEGIVGMHAYSVLEVRELQNARLGQQKTMTDYMSKDPDKSARCQKEDSTLDFDSEGIIRLLRIRNPWGKREWVGAFARGDALWTRRLKAELEQVDKDNGVFWITFHDFLRRFVRVDVCKAGMKGWMGISRRGTTNPMQLHTLEAFSIEVHEECQVYLWLIQKTKRRTRTSDVKSHWYTDLSLIVVDASGIILGCRFSSARRDTTPLELSLQTGVYHVHVVHFDCKHRDSFTLRAYSSSEHVVLDSLPSQSDGPELVQRCLSISASHGLQECIPSQNLWVGELQEAEVSISLLIGNGIRFIRCANTSSKAVKIVAEILHDGYQFLSPISARVKEGDVVSARDRQVVSHSLNAFEQKIVAVCIPREVGVGEVRGVSVLSASVCPIEEGVVEGSLIPLFNAFSMWN